jgi:iron complex outermembrane receptor protein
MIGCHSKSHQLLVASAIVGSMAWHAAALAQETPAPAPAATPPASTGEVVNGQAVTANDIIVTATRTTQRLENVPASIIAVTGQALQTAGVTRFQDLALVAPGVQISRSGTMTQPAIRGISTTISSGGQETNVAVYIDGIYQSDQLSTNQNLTNLQDIQILKGPQGTLYGRNATGGAILITTRSPTNKFQADADVSYSWRFNEKIANVFVGGPIANGIKFSIAASYDNTDGYFTDINGFSKNVVLNSTTYTFGGHGDFNLGQLVGQRNARSGNNTAPFTNWSIRPKLVLEPTDDLKVTLGYVHTFMNDPRGLACGEVHPLRLVMQRRRSAI